LISRTYERARQLADAWQIKVRPSADLPAVLTQTDIVFCTTNAPTPLLTTDLLAPIMAERGGRDLHVADIAVPRNAAPEIAQLPGVQLYNLDKLAAVVQANRQARAAVVPHAQALLQAEFDTFWGAYGGRLAVPTVRQLRAHVEQMRQAELDRILKRLPASHSPEMAALLEEFSHRFMNKMLHHPTQQLKAKAEQGVGPEFSRVTRDLFGLEEML
jgi:glutamyl-tRNA reductase